MAQKYRIYINDSTLFITQSNPNFTLKAQQLEEEGFDFAQFYKNIKSGKKKNYFILTKDAKATFKTIKKNLTVIKAAGGLVENGNGDFLFIFRNKKWDLPKGKVEKGEKIKIAAVREVEEECGVKVAKRNEKICNTYHVYELANSIILKKTIWYSMDVKGKSKLIPQVEEGITAAEWVKPSDVKEKIKNTYPAIIDVLKASDLA